MENKLSQLSPRIVSIILETPFIIQTMENTTSLSMNHQSSSLAAPKTVSTNQVLYQAGVKDLVVYLPSYLMFKVKNFTEMDLDNLSGALNGVIIFKVFYGDLQEGLAQQIFKKLTLQLNRDEAIEVLQSSKIRYHQKQKQNNMFSFTIRQLFHAQIQSEIFWSPFQVINLIITVTVQSIQLNQYRTKDNRKVVVKFNLMDTERVEDKIGYGSEGGFGYYHLAQNMLAVEFSNKQKPCLKNQPKEQKRIDLTKLSPAEQEAQRLFDDKISNFQYAHILIPLYKYPTVGVATIFIPLWLLGIINLIIFFQENDLANRIAAIATLMIAFVALIPTIRQQIPASPTLTFVEMLVYLQSITSLLCLFDSYSIKDFGPQYLMDYTTDGYFIASLIITALNIASVLVLMLLHKLSWEPRYNKYIQTKQRPFLRERWSSNEKCNKYYARFERIRAIPNPTEKKQKQLPKLAKLGKFQKAQQGRISQLVNVNARSAQEENLVTRDD